MNSPSQADSPLVLVVDDDRSLRALLCFAMEEEGYQVVEANNGENCLAEFMRLQPDLVLLDAVMPVMDGFTCCSQLRTLPIAEHTPVLMITVLDDRESVDRAFTVGATDYVTKPIHWPVLRQRVTRLLDVSRSHRQVKKITEALQKQTQRERLFRGIAQRLTQALTLEEILNPSIQDIQAFLKLDRVLLHSKNGDLLAQAVSQDTTSSAQSAGKDLGCELDYAEAFEVGQVIAISDVQQEGVPTAIAQRFARLNMRAVLMVPLVLRGEYWGLLEVAQSNARDWEAELVELLVDIANSIAIAIRLMNQ
ncbi:MAG TPA: response regulator [Chroococcales cyanobacterium]|jgi:DNA-binding response OmpR family regulator